MSARIAGKIVQPISATADTVISSVFSSERNIKLPELKLPDGLFYNKRLKMEGIKFLSKLPDEVIPLVFFDPQYRGILDMLEYGNEGKNRGQQRASLPQMSEKTISNFIQSINRVLIPSGHLFLWMDKFHLCTGFSSWIDGTKLDVVDMVTWDKGKMGMGYRTRRMSEHLIILQKLPRRAKGVWKLHNIPDVWTEKVENGNGVHKKPIDLQGELIEAVSNKGDIVVDPAAGSFSVMKSCELRGRNFLGCDLNG